MSKPLSEMTLNELWQLFPIIIVPHNPDWNNWFNEERLRIAAIIGNDFAYSINHVGSTSINGIAAKSIIDILLEVELEKILPTAQLLADNGWIIMNEMPDRIVLNKGYTPKWFAERVYHLHVKRFGDNKEVVFRDYMNNHPSDAKAYEEMKLSLLPKYKNDRDGYTDAKTDFCNKIYEKAYAELGIDVPNK